MNIIIGRGMVYVNAKVHNKYVFEYGIPVVCGQTSKHATPPVGLGMIAMTPSSGNAGRRAVSHISNMMSLPWYLEMRMPNGCTMD